MNLIKKGYAFKCLYAPFWSVCPALIGRVAHYTPSSELDIQTKIWHRIISLLSRLEIIGPEKAWI